MTPVCSTAAIHGRQRRGHVSDSSDAPTGDLSPSLSRDGSLLYFASDRPGGKGKLDLWVIQTAKLVASIDQVSRGRFLFGVGGGWNQDEMEDHGTVYATRFKRVRESIEAMKEVWTKAEAEYHGEFVNFDPMIARPKPVQKPHPPIHVGGAFPHGARRAIRYGDGWIPGGDIREVLPKFREMAREAGRDPAGIEITSFALGEDLDRVKRLNEMGVARVVPMFPPEKADKVLPMVDRWTKIMQQVNG